MSDGLNIVVLVSGRGSNLQAIIDAQKSKKIKSRVRLVLSSDKRALALEKAKQEMIPIQVIESKSQSKDSFQRELLQAVKNENPDLIVLAGFMKILSEEFIQCFENKIINIHPSLLPAFPGLDAQGQAIRYGVKITGCTVHYVDQGCDTGPIILQQAETVLDTDDRDSLASRLLHKEHQTLVRAIQLIEDNKVVLQGRRTLISRGP